ncbi:MAG TPA: hypothetical protein VJK52_06210 [Candidatus Nanoarchaeia archaeon]|nr:hypothetical protein [Candidatus Nanoarchaeia archaeon]
MGIKESYEKIRKRHRALPSFEKLDEEFELRSAEETHFPLREIRKRMMERLDGYAQYVHELLQPEPTVPNLRESQYFLRKEKEEMYEFYKRLMIAYRSGMEVSILAGEQEHIHYIMEIWRDWAKVKQQMLDILKKAKAAWLKDTEVDVDVSYFG